MKILFATSEVSPYSKTGGLGDVMSSLPRALHHLGHHVSVLSPFYPTVKEVAGPLSRPLSPLRFRLGKKQWTLDVFMYTGSDGVRHFFIDAPELFARDGVYGESGADYEDNALRFAVLSRAAVALNMQYDIGFDVLHCHDWHTALASLYRRSVTDKEKRLSNLATVFTIHNLAHQGVTDLKEASQIGVTKRYLGKGGIEESGALSLIKAGILHADAVTTVSPTYAEEIQEEPEGAGLSHLFGEAGVRVTGILNGLDPAVWSPERDQLLPAHYDVQNRNGKRRCKASLQAHFHLNIRPRLPLVGVVSRLVHQKGIDLLLEVLPEFLRAQELQVVIMGTGDPEIEEGVRELQKAFPHSVGVHVGYTEELAHLVFAGADIFAMPSRFEPCGLSQLYAMRYGTLPVVRDTGGLRDSVVDADENSSTGTGFIFSDATVEDLDATLQAALDAFHTPRWWRQLTVNAMRADFTWRQSALAHEAVYRDVVEKSQ